jgi:formamidopyrimidine-DNA glycosylase
LEGCRIEQWGRRGKYLLAELRHPDGQQAGIWGVHLRMTGQFLWLAAPEGASSGPAGDSDPGQHTRVRIWEQSGAELRFIDTRSFAQMWFVPPGRAVESVITGLARLGPEPFDPGFSAPYLQGRLRGSRRPIKSALLDQSLVAGIGNIYADESLFAAGILPQTVSGRLGRQRLERLRGAVVEILQTSIGAGGTTFSDFRDLTGTNGNYGGQAWVYRRGGLPCRRCGTPLMRDRLAGRSTHWCPCCQK